MAATRAGGRTAQRTLADIDHELARLAVPFDEWETVYRERLQVERDLLARRVAAAPPVELANTRQVQPRGAALAGWAIGLSSAVLLAVDIVLLLVRRGRARRD